MFRLNKFAVLIFACIFFLFACSAQTALPENVPSALKTQEGKQKTQTVTQTQEVTPSYKKKLNPDEYAVINSYDNDQFIIFDSNSKIVKILENVKYMRNPGISNKDIFSENEYVLCMSKVSDFYNYALFSFKTLDWVFPPDIDTYIVKTGEDYVITNTKTGELKLFSNGEIKFSIKPEKPMAYDFNSANILPFDENYLVYETEYSTKKNVITSVISPCVVNPKGEILYEFPSAPFEEGYYSLMPFGDNFYVNGINGSHIYDKNGNVVLAKASFNTISDYKISCVFVDTLATWDFYDPSLKKIASLKQNTTDVSGYVYPYQANGLVNGFPYEYDGIICGRLIQNKSTNEFMAVGERGAYAAIFNPLTGYAKKLSINENEKITDFNDSVAIICEYITEKVSVPQNDGSVFYETNYIFVKNRIVRLADGKTIYASTDSNVTLADDFFISTDYTQNPAKYVVFDLEGLEHYVLQEEEAYVSASNGFITVLRGSYYGIANLNGDYIAKIPLLYQ